MKRELTPTKRRTGPVWEKARRPHASRFQAPDPRVSPDCARAARPASTNSVFHGRPRDASAGSSRNVTTDGLALSMPCARKGRRRGPGARSGPAACAPAPDRPRGPQRPPVAKGPQVRQEPLDRQGQWARLALWDPRAQPVATGAQGPPGASLNPMQIVLLRWCGANTAGITFTVGATPSRAAFGRANVWVANFNSDTVTKLLANDAPPSPRSRWPLLSDVPDAPRVRWASP